MHVSLDTFRCFKFIEIKTFFALKKGDPKEAVIGQIVIDENIFFIGSWQYPLSRAVHMNC